MMHSRLILFLICLGWIAPATAELFTFEIVSGVVPEPSSLSVEIDAEGIGRDDDASSVSGIAVVDLLPVDGPFTHAQIMELDLTLDDGFNFRLGFAGLLTATALPGEVTTRILEPGPQVEIINGVFDQSRNLFGVDGMVELSIQDDPFDLGTLAPFLVDMEGIQITENGNEIIADISLTLVVKGEVEDVPFIGSVPLTITLDGGARGIANRQTAHGDVDGNGTVDARDIDAISNAIRNGDNSKVFDINGDGSVSQLDRSFWVVEIANTYFGDSDLDGEFNTTDFVNVFEAGEYEDNIVKNSIWATGDWNGDQEFDTSDMVVAFQQGGFELGPRALAVPESNGLAFLMLASLWWCQCRRRVVTRNGRA